MNVNFSAWSIRKPVPAILLFVVLCVLGLLSFSKLPVTRFPNIDVPFVSVTVTQSGAAPAGSKARFRSGSRMPSPTSLASSM